jgi:hypothetical protein
MRPLFFAQGSAYVAEAMDGRERRLARDGLMSREDRMPEATLHRDGLIP